MIETRASLREMAVRAHQEDVARRQEREAMAEQERQQAARARLQWCLLQDLHLDVTVESDPCEIDGLVFSTDEDDGTLQVQLTCPACTGHGRWQRCWSVEFLGSLLERYGPALEENRPCLACQQEDAERRLFAHSEGEEWPPTPEERLAATLRELVRGIVREYVGDGT